jgi:hypothetical protein
VNYRADRAALPPMLAGAGLMRSPLIFEIDRIVHLLDGNGLGHDPPRSRE